ncbi:MAG: hypothetical protein ABJG88_12770 [Litorimonas sp.]
MIKAVMIISGLTMLGPNIGGLNLENPVAEITLNISHLQARLGGESTNINIQKQAMSCLSMSLKSGKTINVRF